MVSFRSNGWLLDNFNADAILKHNARILGLPEKLLASSTDVEESRKQRAALLKQQQQMQTEQHNADMAMKQGQARAQV